MQDQPTEQPDQALEEAPETQIKSAFEKASEHPEAGDATAVEQSEEPETTAAPSDEEPQLESSAGDRSGGDDEGEHDAVEDRANTAVDEGQDDYRDRYLRGVAELENYRKRVARERAVWTRDAVRGFATDLIDVLDNLDMALLAVPDEERSGPLSQGVEAVREQLRSALEKRGARRIEIEPGAPFDPDQHAALMMETSDEVEGSVIGMVLRQGYMIDDIVIRPAQVKVLKGTGA
jgi:molecular chaperone GrpE